MGGKPVRNVQRRYTVDAPIDYRSTYQVMAAHIPDPVSTDIDSHVYARSHGIDSEKASRTHKERGARRRWDELPGMAGRARMRVTNDPPPSEVYVTESTANFNRDVLTTPKARSSAPFRNRFKSAASRGPL